MNMNAAPRGVNVSRRRVRTRGLGTAAICVFAAALLAAGCGDDDGSGDEAGASERPAGSPIRVGVMLDASGPVAGKQLVAGPVSEAWAEDVNANGGVAGHPVELVVEDTKGDTPTANRIAQDFIADESIAAVAFQDAATEVAVGELLSKSGLPVIGGLGFTPDIWHGLPNWFGITTSNPALTLSGIVAARDKGLDRMVAASCAEDPGCAEFEQIFQGLVESEGGTYEGQIGITAAQPNYTAECLEFIRAEADFIYAISAPAEAIEVAADCAQQGYDSYFGASAGTLTKEVYDEVSRVTGGLNAFPWFVDAEPVQRYREVVEGAGIDEDDWTNVHASAAWVTMELLKKALEDDAANLGDPVNRRNVLAAYGKIKGETLDGLLPQPVTFAAGEPAPPVDCFWLYTAEDGELSGSFEPECAEEGGGPPAQE